MAGRDHESDEADAARDSRDIDATVEDLCDTAREAASAGEITQDTASVVMVLGAIAGSLAVIARALNKEQT